MTYRGGSYLFGQYVVCAFCCVACPFGESIAPSQTRQWTSYCAIDIAALDLDFFDWSYSFPYARIRFPLYLPPI